MSPKIHKMAAAFIVTIALALLAMMIIVESEPGALPLGLLVLGLVGYITGWLRGRKSTARAYLRH